MRIKSIAFILLVLALAMLGCNQVPTDSEVTKEGLTQYQGTWKLNVVGGMYADSLEKKQILILRSDSTFSCTFPFHPRNTHDTTGFTNPYNGTWSLHTWVPFGGYFGYETVYYVAVDFYQDTVRISGWPKISGGRNDRILNFMGDEGAPADYNLSWELIE